MTSSSDPHPRLSAFIRGALWPALMIVGVIALYLPPGVLRGDFELLGFDFLMLHRHRIDFAQTEIAHGRLPAWYPREFGGAPFWANVQNFPFIPTRLILLWLPPAKLFAVGVVLSAVLTAWFTFLFARRLNLSSASAALAGWTFAAGGFYASRIAAGHLPLLEAYPALPLLLWLVEHARQPANCDRFDRRLLWLGAAVAMMSLAGHPQLFVYAFVVAAAYTIVQCTRPRAVVVLTAMFAGLLSAAAVLYPMYLLIRRSSRVLDLAVAGNDLTLPYARLLAAFFPWRDGVPTFNPADHFAEFTTRPYTGYFWDTVWYIGWWPWIAAVALLVLLLRGTIRISRPALFIVLASVIALALALPWVRAMTPATGGTILRSPARLIYITTFGLSLAGGAAVHFLLLMYRDARRRNVVIGIVGIIAAVHIADLSIHDRFFIRPNRATAQLPPEFEREIKEQIGDGRVGIELTALLPFDRKFDDAGIFDSILLSRTYRAFLAMKNAPPNYNNQWLSAYFFDARMLRAFGVRVLAVLNDRNLPLIRQVGDVRFYRIDGAAQRAAFYPMSEVKVGTSADADAFIRAAYKRQVESEAPADPLHTSRNFTTKSGAPSRSTSPLFVEAASDGSAGASPSTRSAGEVASVTPLVWRRPSSDVIEVECNVPTAGYIRIAEAFDEGWSAQLNGRPIVLHPANICFMAVRVESGKQKLVLRYQTPGSNAGIIMSCVGVITLMVLGRWSAKNRTCAINPQVNPR